LFKDRPVKTEKFREKQIIQNLLLPEVVAECKNVLKYFCGRCSSLDLDGRAYTALFKFPHPVARLKKAYL